MKRLIAILMVCMIIAGGAAMGEYFESDWYQQALKDSESIHARYADALKQSISIIEGNQNELMGQLGGSNQGAAPMPSTPVEQPKNDDLQLEVTSSKGDPLELDEDAFIKEDL